jgi:hypothetical protein
MAQYGFVIQAWLGSGSLTESQVVPTLRSGLELLMEGLARSKRGRS